ncbi:uncharacterized protein [Dysidea avara]|uniref:uncharacterized protein isoform X2 n=1 Tax=Dysidea avara TaxID=196820 RepID=UPI0033305952
MAVQLRIFKILVVSNILGYVLVSGRPEGAPTAACSNIVPRHPGSPSTDPLPYSVDLSDFPLDHYYRGETYTIRLLGSSSNMDFKGFMIQGRARADDSPVGSFDATGRTDYQPQCDGDTAATHTSRAEKTSVDLTWKAPPAGTGELCFRFAFVDQYTLYWANQMTRCLQEATSIFVNGSSSTSGDTSTITLYANVKGTWECSLDGGTSESCSTGETFSGLSAGTHTIDAEFSPNGVSQKPSLQFTVTVADPTPTPKSASISLSTRGRNATVTLTATVPSTFTCSLDGGPYMQCQSGDTFYDLDCGNHTLDVRCSPVGSDQEFDLSTSDFIISCPTSISLSGFVTVSGSSATLTLSSSVSGSFQCSLDGGDFESCSSGSVYTGLSVGSHMVEVIFTPTGSSQMFSFDSPLQFEVSSTTVTTASASVSTSGDKATITLTGDGEFECMLDDGPFMTCESGDMFTGLSDGEHMIKVRFTATGSSQAVMLSRSFGFTISGGVTASASVSTSGDNATITLTGDGEFECMLDDGPFMTCESGDMFTGLSDGEHMIKVRFTATGSSQAVMLPRSLNFTIISGGVTASASVSTSGDKATITLTGDGEFECMLDDGPFMTCESGDMFTGLSDGEHMIKVRFTATGSSQAVMLSRSLEFTILTATASVSTSGDEATIMLTGDGDFECMFNDGPFLPCESGDMYSDLAIGSYTIKIRVTPPGSSQPIMFSQPLMFDIITVQQAVLISVSGSTATLSANVTQPGTLECSIDGGPYRTCMTGSMFTGLSAGQHSINIRFTPAGSTIPTTTQSAVFNVDPMPTPTTFRVSQTSVFLGDKITVTYNVSHPATCTCQLDDQTPISCMSGHMFTGVSQDDHSVIVMCTRNDDTSQTATATVSGLQFIRLTLTLEPRATTITVVWTINIAATCECKLDDDDYVPCFSGYQYRGVSGGSRTVMVRCTADSGPQSTAMATGTTNVRDEDAIIIANTRTDIDIDNQVYNFTFTANEKLPETVIELLIDNASPPVPYQCRRISEGVDNVRCYCYFSNSGGEISTGRHTVTFISRLNGEIRGQTTRNFTITDACLVRFKEKEYSVIEDNINFCVVIEKLCTNMDEFRVSVAPSAGTALVGTDYRSRQVTPVTFPPGPPAEMEVCFDTISDDVIECNETFKLSFIVSDTFDDVVEIDPDFSEADVTIIDDDATQVTFLFGGTSVAEGMPGRRTIGYTTTSQISFNASVESYQCSGDNAATPGVDYEPVNEKFIFTPDVQTHRVDITTIDDMEYEGDDPERICLRVTNPEVPCPNKVTLTQASETELQISENDPFALILNCYTTATGNSVTGYFITVFYNAVGDVEPTFECGINNNNREICSGTSHQFESEVFYGNHTVTVRVESGNNLVPGSDSTFESTIITHDVLLVRGRLSLINSTTLQISIRSTKTATYRCKLNDMPYFSCSDGDIVTNIPVPMNYTLMVEATSTNDSNQNATDTVGPISLSGGSATSTCSGRKDLSAPDGSSNYTATWRARNERVEFELTGLGQSWVGIGFSHDQKMPVSDVVVGAASDSDFFVEDRYAFARSQPRVDTIQNIDNAFASFEDGVMTVRFSRLRDTGDLTEDFSLSNCIFFLFAWGGSVDVATRQIEHHGESRRNFSESLVCIPTSNAFCPERFDCGSPPAPVNGDVMFDSTSEGSVANYSCNFGFRLDGNNQRQCQSTATWSGTVPTCIRIDCGDPGEPSNGNVLFNSTFVGDFADYECDDGFERIGNERRTCQSSGLWTGAVPECRRIDCGDPGEPINGNVLFDSTFVGDFADYECDSGFRLVGVSRRTCQVSGLWNGTVPQCQRIDCGDPGEPENGTALFDSTFVGDIVDYECDDGFRLVGDSRRTCELSGTSSAAWSGAVPECQRIDCGDPGAPSDGDVIFTTTYVDDIATYECNPGFELFGVTQRTCQMSGLWTGTVPECRRVNCGDPGEPENGTAIFDSTFFEDVVDYQCDDGFQLVGNSQRTCQSSGVWSGNVPDCERITCGDPGVPANGMTTTTNENYVDSIARFRCNEGYERNGPRQRRCRDDGTWSNSVPTCDPVDCQTPGTPSNGDALVITTTFGSTVMYSCDSGYALCGDETRMCLSNAMWSGSVPDCIRAEATVERTSYPVNEDAGFANIAILLDQPSCIDVTVIVIPQEQRPVDASSSDFDNSSFIITIPAGMTRRMISIPIVNDTIVEGDEDFDVVLQPGSNGIVIGTPGRTIVTIIDDNDVVKVMFERPMYSVNEPSRQVEVCLLKTGTNEIPVTVQVQPSEVGSADAPSDFSLVPSSVTFQPDESRVCYFQSVVDDDVAEPREFFDVAIVPNPDIMTGDPGTTRINIDDDDGSMIMRNDTVIGDPLYTVPLQISDAMIRSNPVVANTSLCYEIHGRPGVFLNLVSDQCVSINAEYMQSSGDSNLNNVGKVGIFAVDNNGDCQSITIDVMNCVGTVGSTEVTQDSQYNVAGIRVRKGRRYFRIAVPNCERQDLISWVICEDGDMLKFVITRGFNLSPTSHGLVAQFWNVPVELNEYLGDTPDDNLTYYRIKVTTANNVEREFVGHLYDVTWDFTPIPCVYAGNRNGGPVAEFDDPNDSVIEGRYTDYETSGLFSTQFTYSRFDNSRCP